LPLRAAWVEGPVALGADRVEDTLVVGALVEPTGVESARSALWRGLLGVQSLHDLTTELRLYTLADLRTLDGPRRRELEQVLPLTGPPPLDIVDTGALAGRSSAGRSRRHADLEARSREIARPIAELVRRDPSLVEEARRYIERRLLAASPGERLELEEWRSILEGMSIPRLCRFLLQDDARATRLRQSSPFLAVLSPDQRRALLPARATSK